MGQVKRIQGLTLDVPVGTPIGQSWRINSVIMDYKQRIKHPWAHNINDWINGREGKNLPYKRIPVNTCRRNEGNKKPPLELQSNNWCSQESPMHAKISSISELRPI